jgi:hypothetical protein
MTQPQQLVPLDSSSINRLIFTGWSAAQYRFRRDRAEIDGLLHQPQEQQAARS